MGRFTFVLVLLLTLGVSLVAPRGVRACPS